MNIEKLKEFGNYQIGNAVNWGKVIKVAGTIFSIGGAVINNLPKDNNNSNNGSNNKSNQ